MINDIRKTPWAVADKLRANMDAAEYKHLVLGLIFVKYISDTFTARRAEIEARLKNPDDEFHYPGATPDDLAAELDDRDYYTAAKQPDIGNRIDDARALIEQENPRLKGILDKRYAHAHLPDGKLAGEGTHR